MPWYEGKKIWEFMSPAQRDKYLEGIEETVEATGKTPAELHAEQVSNILQEAEEERALFRKMDKFEENLNGFQIDKETLGPSALIEKSENFLYNLFAESFRDEQESDIGAFFYGTAGRALLRIYGNRIPNGLELLASIYPEGRQHEIPTRHDMEKARSRLGDDTDNDTVTRVLMNEVPGAREAIMQVLWAYTRMVRRANAAKGEELESFLPDEILLDDLFEEPVGMYLDGAAVREVTRHFGIPRQLFEDYLREKGLMRMGRARKKVA